MNPTSVGYAICKFNPETNHQTVLEAGVIDFAELAKRLKTSSSSDAQKRQNNKRRYETSMCYKYIFSRCKHYGVSVFSIEDLDMELSEDMGDKDKTSFRRFVNNIWNRSF